MKPLAQPHLFSEAESREDRVEKILSRVHPGDLAQRPRRDGQLGRGNIERSALPDQRERITQRRLGPSQKLDMPRDRENDLVLVRRARRLQCDRGNRPLQRLRSPFAGQCGDRDWLCVDRASRKSFSGFDLADRTYSGRRSPDC